MYTDFLGTPMTKRLSDIMSDIEDVKKNVLVELAVPVQQLVNMVNAKEIETFSLELRKIQEIGCDPYTHIVARIELPATMVLGIAELTQQEMFGSEKTKKLSPETKEKLTHVNSVLTAVNKYLGTALPVEPYQSQSHLYIYSTSRRDLKANWTPEEAAKWPMLPKFLEGLVNLDTPTKKMKMK